MFESSAEPPARFRVAPVARLATVRPDGRPHQVPVVFAWSPDGIYLPIDAKPKTGRPLQRLKNIAFQRNVTLLVDHYDDDWLQLWWVRVDGEATVTSNPATLAAGLELLRQKYPQYETVRLHPQVIVVRPTRVAEWTAG